VRAHLVQLDIVWEDRDANIEQVRAVLDGAGLRPGDLVILPEMFDSGFSLNTETTNDARGSTADALAQMAADHGAYIHGARTLIGDDGMGRNMAHVVNPQGETIAEYAKVHPFSFGREPERFAGGTEIVAYDWTADDASLRVCPAVCYDLRFPELFRAGLTSMNAECFVLGANWPDARQAHWRALLIARAIENQAFVIGVNRVGADPHLSYAGGSMAVGPAGEILLEMDDSPGVGTTEIDPATLHAWRDRFPAWKDAKPWLISPHRRR